MNGFDIRTVVFVGVITDIICTLVVITLWRQNRRRFEGMGFWAADYICQTTGLLMICLRGVIPDGMSIVFANALVVAGAIMGYLGIAKFLGKKVHLAANGLILAAFVLVHSYLTYGQPNLSARSLNTAAALLLVSVQCAWLLLRRADAALQTLTRWVGCVFGAYCLTFFFRIGWLSTHPELTNDYFQTTGSSEIVFLITVQMLFVLLTYGFGLMVNQRLLMAIQAQEEKYSKTFHSSPYAIMLTRLSDGKIMEVNQGFVKIMGYAYGEVVGRTTKELDLWAQAEDRVAVVDQLTATKEVGGAEFQFKKKSGELLTALFSVALITVNNEECLLSSVNDITERKRAEEERERLIAEREKALSEVKTLSGLLPICASCKKIRDDKGYWNQIEAYVRQHSDAEFSHGICPECMRLHFSEFDDQDPPK